MKSVGEILPISVHGDGSSASFVLGEQKSHSKHAHMASLGHLLTSLSGSIRQQHETCGRATVMWPSPVRIAKWLLAWV
jgi:hypothetical protein